MPREKALTKLIPRIYKSNTEIMGLFFFVNAQKQIVPTITVQQAIINYFRFADIEDWDPESARTAFERLQKAYFEDCRS